MTTESDVNAATRRQTDAYDSWMVREVSASTVGLSHRWIIKSVLVLGLGVATVAGLAVWLQVAYVLFGPQGVRFHLMTLDWPEEEGSKIEGKERIKLEEATTLEDAPVVAEIGAKT